MKSAKVGLLIFCSCSLFNCFSQDVFNLVSSDSIKTQIRNEAGIKCKVVKRNNDRFLKIESPSSTNTPSSYLVKSKVVPGRVYTYMVSASPCGKDKTALHVASPMGDIGWGPTTMVAEGVVRQVFSVPKGTNEVTLAIAFMYPHQGACVYVYDIGFFEGDVSTSSWHSSDEFGLRPFIGMEELDAEVKSNEEVHKRTPLPENIFFLNDLSEIKTKVQPDCQIKIKAIKRDGEGFLKINCTPTTWTPSVLFKTLKVKSGQTYSYIIVAKPSEEMKAYFYVETVDSKNVVWPGLKIVEGVNKQIFIVPEGVNEVNIGFSFINPDPHESILIKDVGVYQGDIDAFSWVAKENEGLEPWLKMSNRPWLWLIFPIAIAILILLYFRDGKVYG